MDGLGVVIAGGAGGLGRATARLCAQRGARVGLIDNSQSALDEVVAWLEESGLRAAAVAGSIAGKEEAAELFASLVDRIGPVRAMVNCVGIYPRVPLLEITDEQWRESLTVNVVGTYNLMVAAARHMAGLDAQQDVRGRIVNISSIDAFKAHPKNAHYAAGKAGVVSLTRSFALELAPDKILVNSVAPAAIATERGKASDWMEEHVSATPLGRAAEPEDIAETIAFLAGPGNRYTTGENVIVSGGYLIA